MTDTYDPARGFVPIIEEPRIDTFSPASGTFTYALTRPARVHIQAGMATTDPKTKEVRGPVLRTISDRQPRAAGRIVEAFSGFDESGSVYLPDLPHFVLGVFAASLPDAAIVTTGNAKEPFRAYAKRTAKGRPASVVADHSAHAGHAHHQGLNALDDRSPAVTIKPDGTWDEKAKAWRVKTPFRLKVALDADAPAFFSAKGSALFLFIGETRIVDRRAPGKTQEITIGDDLLPPGEQILAANWTSGIGPVGVSAIRVIVEPSPKRSALR